MAGLVWEAHFSEVGVEGESEQMPLPPCLMREATACGASSEGASADREPQEFGVGTSESRRGSQGDDPALPMRNPCILQLSTHETDSDKPTRPIPTI